MYDVIFVCDETELLDKINNASIDTKKYNSFSVMHSRDAFAYCKNNDFSLVLISLDSSIINSNIIEYISSIDDTVNFIFIFDSVYFYNAVEYYNKFERVLLITKENFNPSDLNRYIDNFSNENKDFEEVSTGFRLKQYEKQMSKYSEILNHKINSFNDICSVYTGSITKVLDGYGIDSNILKNFILNELNSYIQIALVDEPNFIDIYKRLSDELNITSELKHYLIVNNINDFRNKETIISFICVYISYLFAHFLKKYRIKLELKEIKSVFILDLLVDCRLGDVSEDILGILCDAAKKSLESITDKVEFGVKAGIRQYRIYIKSDK